VPGSRGIVLHQNYMNEAASVAGGSTLYRKGWGNALRTAWALMGAQQVMPITSRGGSWTELIASDWFGGECWFTADIGATATFNPPAGYPEAWLLVGMSSPEYPTSDLEVEVDGVPVLTISTDSEMAKYATVHGGGNRYYAPAAYRVPGGCTITVKVLEAKKAFVAGMFLPMPNPPRIFYGLEPTRNPTATGGAAFAATTGYFRAIAAQVAADFPNVTLVDLDPGWDNATMVGSLDPNHLHPNDLGMIHIADRFTQAIQAEITEPLDGVMVF
jgi:hypothetical protein